MNFLSMRDVLGGILLILVGIGTVIEGSTLTIGHLTQMGAGYFPIVLGCILAGLGILLTAGGLLSREGHGDDHAPLVKPDWRGCCAIIAGVLAFLLVGGRFGLAPGTFACVLISALGDRSTSAKGALILAIAVTAFTVGLFWYLLRIQFPILRW